MDNAASLTTTIPDFGAVHSRSLDSNESAATSMQDESDAEQHIAKRSVTLVGSSCQSLHEIVDDRESNFLIHSSDTVDQSQQHLPDSVSNFIFPDTLDRDTDDEPLDLLEQQQTALQFAMEHQIFLRAALTLLKERDLRAPTLGMMDPMVLKSGPLKKASHLMNGVWKVKYVEIRRGSFTYYENAINDGEILRKNIPLQAHNCSCRAVRLHKKALKFTPRGAILELEAAGTKRLWLATSREERQNWLNAIHTATVGGSVTTSGAPDAGTDHRGRIRHVSPRSPFKQDLRLYLKIQNTLRQASTKHDYISGLRELENNPIRVPIKWIAKQTLLSSMANSSDFAQHGHSGSAAVHASAFQELGVDLSVEQLWRDLKRDAVSINGAIWHGNETHGPEAIVGAVAHSILRASRESTNGQSDMMESQALAYARDILLAGNRTRSGGDSYFCISTLCSNSELVVVTPSAREAEPVALLVTEEKPSTQQQGEGRVKSKTGWMKKRNKLQRAWKGFFFVLSEGTLSYYDGALPRPHGLRGVVLLTDAVISVVRKRSKEAYFVVTIATKDGKEHFLRLDSEGRLVEWLYVLEREAKANRGESQGRFYMRRKSSNSREDDTPLGSASNAPDSKTIAEQATASHAKSLGLNIESVKERIAAMALQTTSAVRIAIQARTEYNICTTDPSGEEEEDTWGVVNTYFQQNFLVTGGPSGRITRGEEIVRVSLVHTGEIEGETDPGAMSPKRSRKGRKFRNSNMVEEGAAEVETKYIV
ncbi:hypothetical protein ACA910_002837 [Epithemia clementina (nom. ined.)]